MIHFAAVKHNHKPYHSESDQRGAMAMFTVVFLALLLSIVTLSFVRLSVTEQRQASDDALTTRAYYAAESGLEDAKRALVLQFDNNSGNDPDNLNADVCRPAEINSPIDPAINVDGNAVLSDALQTYYTCQRINLTPPDYQAEIERWESITVPLSSAPDSNGVPQTFNIVEIEWHQQGGDFNGDYTLDSPDPSPNLPTFPDWNAGLGAGGIGYPAMLRTQFFSTDITNTLRRVHFNSVAAVVRPATGGSAIPSITSSTYDEHVHNVDCQDSAVDGEYVCSARFSGFNNPSPRVYYLHLTALYRATNIKISLFEANDPRSMQDAQAIIDVTGQAGDVFRRIEARVGLTNVYPLPDYAIWSNEEICKDFTIATTINHYLNNCVWENIP